MTDAIRFGRLGRLIASADPAAGKLPVGLSPRAQDELRALVGRPADHGDAPRGWSPRSRHGRRMALASAVLAAAALVSLAIAGVLALPREGAPPPMADQPFYGTTRELEGSADSIVRATIISTQDLSEDGFPETVATLQVSRVAKGEIEVGAQVDIVYPTVGSGPETPVGLATGGEYVFFLLTQPDGVVSLVNTTQGYYQVVAGGVVAGPENPVKLGAEVRHELGLD